MTDLHLTTDVQPAVDGTPGVPPVTTEADLRHRLRVYCLWADLTDELQVLTRIRRDSAVTLTADDDHMIESARSALWLILKRLQRDEGAEEPADL